MITLAEKLTIWIENRSDELALWTMFLVLSVWGGVINVIRKYKYENKFRLVEAFGELSASALCGIIIGLLSHNYLPITVSLALAGVSGHMGSRTLYMIEFCIQRKLGLTQKDVNQIKKEEKQNGI